MALRKSPRLAAAPVAPCFTCACTLSLVIPSWRMASVASSKPPSLSESVRDSATAVLRRRAVAILGLALEGRHDRAELRARGGQGVDLPLGHRGVGLREHVVDQRGDRVEVGPDRERLRREAALLEPPPVADRERQRLVEVDRATVED